MDVEEIVRSHYAGTDLEGRILRALTEAGVDLQSLTVADLGPIDQLHLGGLPATASLLEQLDLSPQTRLLDVGCGLGGAARAAAERYACPVLGVDLSPDFVATALRLTARLRLDGLVTHVVAPGDRLDVADGTFDRAMMIHVGMNIEDKKSVFAEVRRVLRPGGRFAVYEQMRVGAGSPTYPLPWAEDERSSFVSTPEDYSTALTGAGLVVERTEDRTEATVGTAAPNASVTGERPQLGPGAVFGPGFRERLGNNVAAIRDHVLAPVLIVARAR